MFGALLKSPISFNIPARMRGCCGCAGGTDVPAASRPLEAAQESDELANAPSQRHCNNTYFNASIDAMFGSSRYFV